MLLYEGRMHVAAFGLRVAFLCIVVTVAPWAPEIFTWLWWHIPRRSLCAYTRCRCLVRGTCRARSAAEASTLYCTVP